MKKMDRSNYLNRIITSLIGILCLISVSESTAQYKVYGIAKGEMGKKHGRVITYEPMQYVVMDCQGDTIKFDLQENSFKFTTRKPPKPYIFPEGVGYHRIALGLLPGQPGDGAYLGYDYHYQRTRWIGYGGGLSFENYGDVDGYDFLVPSVNFYSYFLERNASPFLRVTAGYGIAIKNTAKFQEVAQGGVNISAALGYRLSTNHVMIDIALGARFQNAYYEFDFNDFTKTSDILFQRLDFSVGFMW